VETITDVLFAEFVPKILALKVMVGGNELIETIEQLIEFNQQVTLDLNEAD